MALYVIDCSVIPYLTLVVRARSVDEACELGAAAASQYLDAVPAVDATLVDPDGPSGVIVEDAS